AVVGVAPAVREVVAVVLGGTAPARGEAEREGVEGEPEIGERHVALDHRVGRIENVRGADGGEPGAVVALHRRDTGLQDDAVERPVRHRGVAPGLDEERVG
ncbi:MAG: hypothetical protein ACK559_17690, partial [bacterium]